VVEDAVQDEGQGGDHVDYVDGLADEDALLRGDDEPDEDLEREPGRADAFYVEERLVNMRMNEYTLV